MISVLILSELKKLPLLRRRKKEKKKKTMHRKRALKNGFKSCMLILFLCILAYHPTTLPSLHFHHLHLVLF